MDNRAAGEQLSQLSRLLLDAAADKWYKAIILEVFAGLFAIVLSVLNLPGSIAIVGAIVGLSSLVVASVWRLQFDDQYDAAETMRRQSVITEGLNWPIDAWQLREWKAKAGDKILAQLRVTPRPADYYETQVSYEPERLARMTLESAFYTRLQYTWLRGYLIVTLVSAAAIALLLFLLVISQALPQSAISFVAKAVFILIPVVLSVNLLGWVTRLTRLIKTIGEVEKGLHQIQYTSIDAEGQVLRLVSEYNCQVIGGFPIHGQLFKRWRPTIQSLWNDR